MEQKNATHESYDELLPVWQKCRDAVKGERAIHKAGKKYLPELSGQTDGEYKSYLKRASFFNATGRTVEGMSGLIYRKAPVIDLPDAFNEWVDDIDMAGKTLNGFIRQAVNEVLTVGRGGILVDFPPAPQSSNGTAITIAQSRAQGLRPYMAYYKAETIIDWEMGRVGNVTRLIRVSLSEDYRDDKGQKKQQIRELTFEDGAYVQNVWRQSGKGWELFDTVTPTRNGQAILEIPFFFLAPDEPDCEIQDSPIEDLVNVNLSHYLNSADLENGAHVSGLPTPYVSADIDDDENFKFHLGGSGLLLPKDSTAGFLQCGSEGFATLEKLMDRKQEQMAALGARMIAPEKKAAEAAETASIRRGGENSVLASIAGAIQMQMVKALQTMADWAGVSGEIRLELNKDFMPMPMSAQELTAHVGAWQNGAISKQTLFEALVAGEVIGDGVDFDEENERIESEVSLGSFNDLANDGQ